MTKHSIRAECLRPHSQDWQVPSAAEVQQAIAMAGDNKTHLAQTLGVLARQVRRWAEGTPIPYTSWAILCYEAGLGVIWRKDEQ